MGKSEPKPWLLYMMPKIHKNLTKWSKLHEVLPSRPIFFFIAAVKDIIRQRILIIM